MNNCLEAIKHYDFGKKLSDNNPSIYLQSQLHGNETFSTLVLYSLINHLSSIDKSSFLGSVRVVPRANPFSWNSYLYSRNGVFNPTTGVNWNRIFSWNLETDFPKKETSISTLRQSVIKKISNETSIINSLKYYLLSLSIGYNYIIDVHTPENGIPHLYCSKFTSNTPTFDIKYVIEYKDEHIDTFDDAHKRIIQYFYKLKNNTAISIELDSNVPATQTLVKKWTTALMDELSKIGIVKNDHENKSIKQCNVTIGKIKDYQTQVSGIQNHFFSLGDVVTETSPLFSILPFDLKSEIIIKAESNCIPLCLRKDTIVYPGAWVVRALEI